MNLFEVYKLWDIEPVKGLDTTLWDKNGEVYTDLYGGHAVISVGHCHPHYVKKLSEQLGQLGFYSNAVQNKQPRLQSQTYHYYLHNTLHKIHHSVKQKASKALR